MVTLFLALNTNALADPVADSRAMAAQGNYDGAMGLLTSANSADPLVKAALAEALVTFPPPNGNKSKGCALAFELAAQDDVNGELIKANCLLLKYVPDDHPYEDSRAIARHALTQGDKRGKLIMYQAFVADPAYEYRVNGRPDGTKYNSLAQTPIADRQLQIEALNNLSSLLEEGSVEAGYLAIDHLQSHVGDGNNALLFRLFTQLDQSHYLKESARNTFAVMGKLPFLTQSHASLTTIADAMRTATPTAMAVAQRQKISCPTGPSSLSGIQAGSITDAVYLPISGVLAKSYLVKGAWQEIWTVTVCGSAIPVTIQFQADGWGGAFFQMVLKP